MHIVRFFPIGNGDSCLIELENGRTILFDYADLRDPNDENDLRCDLLKELKDCLGDRKEIDVVAFTHFDRDQCHRAKEVFYLEHAEKYQSDDRITDGGVYDNLGLSPFWPGRDPSMSLDMPKPDILIICRAGYGLEKQPRSLFLLSRMKAVVESIHARVENLAINRVFNLGQSGEYERVILAYLGQDDRKLKSGGTIAVGREQALGYPTNFSAMPALWIEHLAARGEQVMAAVLAEHWPELVNTHSDAELAPEPGGKDPLLRT